MEAYRSSRLGFKMATIYVGDQAQPFTVHHHLLTSSSDLFAKALVGECKKQDSVVHLKAENSSQFSIYFQWPNI
jgi:hypothetical protein